MPYEQESEINNARRTDTRVFLQPIAAPYILGLYGLAGATFMVAANMAHWFGTLQSNLTLLPFAAIFGGLAQFLAGMWAFKARDGVATAIHGMWGSFWMAYGLLGAIFAVGHLTPPAGRWTEMGFWFIVLAAITWVCCAASVAQNKGLFLVLLFLAGGSTCAAIGMLAGVEDVNILAGWLLIISSVIAWYTASALMLKEAFGHEVWPFGASRLLRELPPITPAAGEPGVIRGQA
ncbi:MAG: acetate uptake transporter family protein [Acidobacteriota bacterium]